MHTPTERVSCERKREREIANAGVGLVEDAVEVAVGGAADGDDACVVCSGEERGARSHGGRARAVGELVDVVGGGVDDRERRASDDCGGRGAQVAAAHGGAARDKELVGVRAEARARERVGLRGIRRGAEPHGADRGTRAGAQVPEAHGVVVVARRRQQIAVRRRHHVLHCAAAGRNVLLRFAHRKREKQRKRKKKRKRRQSISHKKSEERNDIRTTHEQQTDTSQSSCCTVPAPLKPSEPKAGGAVPFTTFSQLSSFFWESD